MSAGIRAGKPVTPLPAKRASIRTVEIKCDYDGRIPANFQARLEFVVRVLALRVRSVRFDKTMHGFHAVVIVATRRRMSTGENVELLDAEIVAVQLALGSDYKRELFNLSRVRMLPFLPPMWRKRWNVLYHRHYKGVSL